MQATQTRAEEYVAVDHHGRIVAGPFDYYSQAKTHADAAGGYVKFLAEEAAPGSAVTVATTFADAACDFDSIEAAAQHEKASGGKQGSVGDAVYIFYPGGLARRVYYQSGKYHVARRAEPLTQAAEGASERCRYHVVYLTHGARRARHMTGEYTLDEVQAQLKYLKRRGMTAWVETEGGTFTPVPGAMRKPAEAQESAEAKEGATAGPIAHSKTMQWHPHGNEWKATGPRTGAHYKVKPVVLQANKRRPVVVYQLTDDNGAVDTAQTVQKAMQYADELEATRHNGHAQEKGKRGKKPLAKAKEDFAVATRDVKAVRAGRAAGSLRNAQAIYSYVHSTLVKYSQEVVLVIPLDHRGKPLCAKPYVVAMGQKAEVSVNIEDVLRPVIKDNASGFVVIHNHPSGEAIGSKADHDLTARIRKGAAKACPSTPLLDHVVVGDGQFYSFADEQLYKVKG